MGNGLEPDSRAMELKASLAAMHTASMKRGKSFSPVPQLKGKDRGEKLGSTEEIWQPGRDSSSQCLTHCSTYQEDIVFSRGVLSVQNTKVWSAWRRTRRPGPEEVCIGTSVLCRKLACAELPS